MGKPRYLWRKLTPSQRDGLMLWRKQQGLPWHRPPHRASSGKRYHLTAACYEHQAHIGRDSDRMRNFCETLLGVIEAEGGLIHAWCVLPNHYHVLVKAEDLLNLVAGVERMHGRVSYNWNGEELRRRRQVWCGVGDRYIRNDAHFWATMNYIHNNPVRHGYVQRWQEWPFPSAKDYLVEMGREFAERVWREYPVRDYGKGWDDPGL